MGSSFAKGGIWNSTVQKGFCQYGCATRCVAFELKLPPTNVSCDDTGLPARSSIGPLSLSLPVIRLRNTTFDSSESTVTGKKGVTIRSFRMKFRVVK